MQNNEQFTPATLLFNALHKGFHSSAICTAFLFLISILLPSSVIAEKKESTQLLDQPRFLAYEIAGVSLQTPPDSISSILEDHGYTQTGSATYTKQIQVPGQRKAIYRIEIDDTPAIRQITYFRGQSGGRVKSSALKEKPLQADEIEMANELYQIVCGEISPQTAETRTCQPATDALLIFGNGEFLDISNNFGAQLNASADATTIGIKYIKQ